MPLHDDLVQLRRQLHRFPEIGLHLPNTQQTVLRALGGLPLDISVGTGLSSVTAVLRGGRHPGRGPVVLLRGDMDALPRRARFDDSVLGDAAALLAALAHRRLGGSVQE